MSIYGPGGWLSASQGFIDASGKEENWYYTDLWMRLSKYEDLSDDQIQNIAVAINALHNPIYDFEGFNFEGINIGEFIEKTGMIISLFKDSAIESKEKGEGVARGQAGKYGYDKNEIGINEILVKGLVCEGIFTWEQGYSILLQTVAHEASHLIFSGNYSFSYSIEKHHPLFNFYIHAPTQRRYGVVGDARINQVMRAMERAIAVHPIILDKKRACISYTFPPHCQALSLVNLRKQLAVSGN